MLLIYGLAIFCGAALLFLVQPMFARMMLPQLGGSPAVWNTAMVFYQAALLAGYAYAHYSTRWLGARRQAILHCVLMLAPLAVLPIALNPVLKPPTTTSPIPWIFGVMTLAVGLPFFVVSATSPLLQRWFATTDHPAARDPYFLYAASNAGSLLALLAYPALLEPRTDLWMQSQIWSWGYGILLVLLATCVVLLWRAKQPEEQIEQKAIAAAKIPGTRKLRWILLSFVPSSWMLSVTTYLTTDIAAFPLLWIIPLTLYLLTFIWVFSSRRLPQFIATRAYALTVLPLIIVMCVGATSPIKYLILLHLVVFFVASLACHGALAEDRPAPENLTEFFLLMSLGGVLGGAFNALLAPLIFNNVTEYPLIIVLGTWFIIDSAREQKRESPDQTDFQSIIDVVAPLIVGGLCAVLILTLKKLAYGDNKWMTGIMFGVPCVIAFAFSRRPLRYTLTLGLIFLAANFRPIDSGRTLYEERSFFGVLRVLTGKNDAGPYHYLMHGSTLHGQQSTSAQYENMALTYYANSGPLGQTFKALQELHGDQFKNIGVVGLGTGTTASYGLPHQRWTLYEIDPAVEHIASDPDYFTYLRNCKAPYKIVLGDGRLQLENARDGEYDLLVLDAYSSDSLPVHLLTREALQLYLRKLSPTGVMAFNVSNRHLDLEPLMSAFAHDLKLMAYNQTDNEKKNSQNDQSAKEWSAGKTSSQWVVLTRNKSHLGRLLENKQWKVARTRDDLAVWTDGYSSLLSVFGW